MDDVQSTIGRMQTELQHQVEVMHVDGFKSAMVKSLNESAARYVQDCRNAKTKQLKKSADKSKL